MAIITLNSCESIGHWVRTTLYGNELYVCHYNKYWFDLKALWSLGLWCLKEHFILIWACLAMSIQTVKRVDRMKWNEIPSLQALIKSIKFYLGEYSSFLKNTPVFHHALFCACLWLIWFCTGSWVMTIRFSNYSKLQWCWTNVIYNGSS